MLLTRQKFCLFAAKHSSWSQKTGALLLASSYFVVQAYELKANQDAGRLTSVLRSADQIAYILCTASI